MDSGNSGSMQSSSGGDEEYDSRSDQSSFLMGNLLSSSSNPNLHQPTTTTATTTFFDDPSSSNNYINIINNTPFNMISQSHFSQLSNLGKLPTASAHHQALNQSRPFPTPISSSSDHHHHHQAGVGVVTKNSKKRTRASRRAPTTVLTTDTSNFRAMVQEFTGIPAPPFSPGSLYSSARRLDILRSGHHHLDSLYNPFRGPPQKVQSITPSLVQSSSSSSFSSSLMLNHHITVDSTHTATSMASSINTGTLSSNSMNYLLIPELTLPKTPLNNLLNIQQNSQNPVSSFQSLLAHHHHHPHDLHQTISSLDGLGHVNANVGGLQQGQGATNGGDINRDNDHDQLRPFNVSSSEFDPQEKSLGININNVSSSRSGEGTNTFDSWICPTD